MLRDHLHQPRFVFSTNGVLTEKIVSQAAEMAKGGLIAIRISTDGVGEVHDRIRAHKGCFEKIMKTLRACRPRACATSDWRAPARATTRGAGRGEEARRGARRGLRVLGGPLERGLLRRPEGHGAARRGHAQRSPRDRHHAAALEAAEGLVPRVLHRTASSTTSTRSRGASPARPACVTSTWTTRAWCSPATSSTDRSATSTSRRGKRSKPRTPPKASCTTCAPARSSVG